MFNVDDIDECFPMSSYREGQRECIEFVAKSFENGKRFVILECPTGSGKSAIGMTLANMVNHAYYLTITKILQDQLIRDFEDDIVALKGRNAYPCTYYDRHGQTLVDRGLWSTTDLENYKKDHDTCASGFCRTKWNLVDGKRQRYKCPKCFQIGGPVRIGGLAELTSGGTFSDCPYYEQVFQALSSPRVAMNFASFLYQTTMTKRFDAPRDLMVIDEAHNIESEILNFVSLTIDDTHLQKRGLFIPRFDRAEEYAMWFNDMQMSKVFAEAIAEARDDSNHKLEDILLRTTQRYVSFMESVGSDEEWVCEYEEKKFSNSSRRSVTLRPVFAKNFAEPLLFKYARCVVMMSATILDIPIICRSLGIDRNEVAAYRMKNRFPVENRPIYLNTVAKMTGGKSKMHEWAPPLLKAVESISDNHNNDRGIIHTHNFAIMDYILKHCSKGLRGRLLDQRNFRDKKAMLDVHTKQQRSIIIAPAMHEGIDLVDDLSRFQIICKVPYANCFDDEQLARRVEIDRAYYDWITALKLVQSYGRSIRSENDYADTYILDESIYRFLRVAKNMLPRWFHEAIHDNSGT